MCVGALVYSISVGLLSSLLSSLDSKDAAYQERLSFFMKIKAHYKIDNSLFNRVKKALKYVQNKFNFIYIVSYMKRSDDDRIEFLNELPINLRIKVNMIMKFDMLIILAFFYYASTYSCWCRVFRSIPFLIMSLLKTFLRSHKILDL